MFYWLAYIYLYDYHHPYYIIDFIIYQYIYRSLNNFESENESFQF